MKRDDDCIRALLIEAAETEDGSLIAILGLTPNAEDEKRYSHSKWLADYGFFDELEGGIFRITEKGSDFLTVIRDETVWTQTKYAAAAVGEIGLGAVMDIAVSYYEQAMSAPSRTPL